MNERLQNGLIGFFFKECSNLAALNLMRRAIYVFLLFTLILFIPHAATIWGPDSMIMGYKVDVFSTSFIFNLLFHPVIAPYYFILVGIHFIFLVFGILSIYPRLTAVILFITTCNLSNRMYLMNTAGEQLIILLLFYLIFVSTDKEKPSEQKKFFNNLFSFACFFQLVILYFFSGIYKLYGSEWLDGSALYLTLMMDEFTHPLIKDNLNGNNFFLTIATYITLVYQLSFPIFIWFKKVRKYFLPIGILFHLGIAFFIGIFNFGLIMVIAYIMYMDNEKARRINSRLDKILRFKRITRQTTDVPSSSI